MIIDCLTTIETEMGSRKLMSSDFKSFGTDITIYPQAKFIKPEVIEIGDHTKIDDFTFIYGGKGTKIGKYVHIASFVSIIGGGVLYLGDYVAIAAGARIITGTNKHKKGFHMSASAPQEQQYVDISSITIEKDAFIGTNAVIHPGVVIGEGAIIGSNSLVMKDIEPWTINIGSPTKIIGKRERF